MSQGFGIYFLIGCSGLGGNEVVWGLDKNFWKSEFLGFLLVAAKSRFLTSLGMTKGFLDSLRNDKTGRASLDGRASRPSPHVSTAVHTRYL